MFSVNHEIIQVDRELIEKSFYANSFIKSLPDPSICINYCYFPQIHRKSLLQSKIDQQIYWPRNKFEMAFLGIEYCKGNNDMHKLTL